MMLMMIAAMIVRVSNLSRKGHDDDNKENGEGASEDNEKKEVKIQENVDKF